MFAFPRASHTAGQGGQADLFNRNKQAWQTVWDGIGTLPPADAPSETALKVAGTIKGRIARHGY